MRTTAHTTKASQQRPNKKTKTAAGKKAAQHRQTGVGAYVVGLLIKGKSTEEILKAVAARFPEAHTSKESVSWYRSKLNKEGKH